MRLFNAFGFRIGADISWFVVLFLMIYLLSQPFRETLHSSDGIAYLTTVISVLLLFASMLAHELGHALVARRQGIEVAGIDLYLFGGLTQMSRDVATAAEDFKVAVAGPLATLGVIALCVAVDIALVGPHRLLHAIVLDSDIQITPVLLCLSWLLPMNVLLLVFNLVPALPLDGGRIARAAIWGATGDRRRATAVSARLGQGFALVLAAAGLWLGVSARSFAGLWLIALAFLLYQSARGALVQSALNERIEGVRVRDIMDTQPVSIPAATPVGLALEEYFLRYGWSWFPVVDESGRLTGIAEQPRAQAAADAGEGWLTIGSALADGGINAWRVQQDRPISELLGSESLGRLGAVMAVDGDGVLRGVVTIEQVRRALRSAVGTSAA